MGDERSLAQKETLNRLRQSLIPIITQADLSVRSHLLVEVVCGLKEDDSGNLMNPLPFDAVQMEDPKKRFEQAMIEIEQAIVSGKIELLDIRQVITEAFWICATLD
jgi:hypothetical protein